MGPFLGYGELVWDSERSTFSGNPLEGEIGSGGGVCVSLGFPVFVPFSVFVSVDRRLTTLQEFLGLEGFDRFELGTSSVTVQMFGRNILQELG